MCRDSPAEQLLAEVNRVRQEEDLPPLAAEIRLAHAAELHAADLAKSGGAGHVSEDGRGPNERVEDEGIQFDFLGENVAAGYTHAALVVEAWLQSSAHRRVLLHPRHRYVGVGVVEAPTKEWFWVADFADLRDEARVLRGGCHA